MPVREYPAVFSGRTQYSLIVVVNDDTQSMVTNRTTLGVQLIARKVHPHSGAYSFDPADWYIDVAGARRGTGSIPGYDFRNIPQGGGILLWSGNVAIQHASNGAAPTVQIDAAFVGGPLGGARVGPGPIATIKRIPRPPAAPAITAISAPTSSSIQLAWSAPNAMGGTISSYRIRYADNPGFTGATTIETGSTTRSRTLSVKPGKTYSVQVAARNEAGLGPYSTTQSLPVGIGGKRFNGSAFVDLSIAKRLDDSGNWVDIQTAKRLTTAGWVDLS